MKVLLVTSLLTYMPRNYYDLFESLLREVPDYIHGLVLLDNLDHKVLKSIVGLPLLGAGNIFKELTTNIAKLPLRERERLLERYHKKVYKIKTMNSKEAIEIIKENNIDLVINLRTRDIYKKEVLNAPHFGCMNIHHGLLPKYRGTMCDLYALSEGREAGFSIHMMNEKIDAGAIHQVVTVSHGEERDYMGYLAKTAAVEGRALASLLRAIHREIETSGKLPEGEPNVASEKVYTKNPTRKQVSEMKKKGMIL